MHVNLQLSIYIRYTDLSLQVSTPAQVGPIVARALFAFLLYYWHDEGNWSVGLVNQCQAGWADCI